MSKMRTLRRIRKDKWLLLMLIPGITFFVIFSYMPMYGLIMAFQNYSPFRGISGSPFVGLKHFQNFFDNPYLTRIIRNTVLLSLYGLFWGFPAPIIFACLINNVRQKPFKRVVQSVSYFPNFISIVILIGLLRMLTNQYGVVNSVIVWFGGEPIRFMQEAKWFRSLYIGSGIWQGVGFGSIVYLGAITGIDPQLYEASRIDGSTKMKDFVHITIPSIMPTITMFLILSASGIFSSDTAKILLMYSPITYEVSDVIGTYMFRLGIEQTNLSFSTAVGLMQSIIGCVLVFGANWLSRRVSEHSLW